MISCAHSNENHSSACTTIKVFEILSGFSKNGNGKESGLLFGNKWELEYSLRFPKVGNGNGNEVMGMGGNGYTKVIAAHL